MKRLSALFVVCVLMLMSITGCGQTGQYENPVEQNNAELQTGQQQSQAPDETVQYGNQPGTESKPVVSGFKSLIDYPYSSTTSVADIEAYFNERGLAYSTINDVYNSQLDPFESSDFIGYGSSICTTAYDYIEGHRCLYLVFTSDIRDDYDYFETSVRPTFVGNHVDMVWAVLFANADDDSEQLKNLAIQIEQSYINNAEKTAEYFDADEGMMIDFWEDQSSVITDAAGNDCYKNYLVLSCADFDYLYDLTPILPEDYDETRMVEVQIRFRPQQSADEIVEMLNTEQ